MSAQISKKRKFVADGVFRAELGEFFTRELAEEGYSGCDVRVTHARTEVLLMTTRPEQSAYIIHGIDYHPRHPYPRSPWRERPPYP